LLPSRRRSVVSTAIRYQSQLIGERDVSSAALVEESKELRERKS
jgi:hypothetical protein